MPLRLGPADLGIRASSLSDYIERVEPFAARLNGRPETAEALARAARNYVDGQRWIAIKSSRIEARRALEGLDRPCKTLLTVLRSQSNETRKRLGQLLLTCDGLQQRDVSMSALGRDLQALAAEPALADLSPGTDKRPGFCRRLIDLGNCLEALPIDSEWQFYVLQTTTPLLDPTGPVEDAMARLVEAISAIACTAASRVTRRGPTSNTMLMRAIEALAELWISSGRTLTHSDTVDGSHTGKPHSQFGRFATDFIAEFEPNPHRRRIGDALEHVAWPSRQAKGHTPGETYLAPVRPKPDKRA